MSPDHAAAWHPAELERIASAEEVEVASLRPDGSLTRPVVIWVVSHAGELYIRSWKGPKAGWYRATQMRREGRIAAGGLEKDVSFERVDGGSVDGAVDAAYRSKYRRYGGSYVDEMIAPLARATTLKLVPRPG